MDSAERLAFLGRVKEEWLACCWRFQLQPGERDIRLRQFLDGVLIGVANRVGVDRQTEDRVLDEFVFEFGQSCGAQGGDLSDLDALMVLVELAGAAALENLDV